MMHNDVHSGVEIHAETVEYWRRMTPAERFARTVELTQIERDKVRREVRQTHPDATEDEFRVLLVERFYGSELANEVREHLKNRSKSSHS